MNIKNVLVGFLVIAAISLGLVAAPSGAWTVNATLADDSVTTQNIQLQLDNVGLLRLA